MKKIFLMLALCCVSLTGVVAQYSPVTIRTPNGSVVPDTGVFTGTEIPMSSSALAALDTDLRVNYNGATRVGLPTRKYNCHAYAWHVTEGGSNVWLGLSSTTAHNIYWTDGSYLEVAENASTKVVYTGNHSAIRIDSNWYQSKWGASALVKHHPNNVPSIYSPASPKHYYKMLSISGPDAVPMNSNATHSVSTSSLPSGVTFSHWSVTGYSYTITSGTTSPSISIRTGSTTGNYTLSANFNLSNGATYTITKYVSVTPPVPVPILSVRANVSGHAFEVAVTNPMGGYFDWAVNGNIITPNPGGVAPFIWLDRGNYPPTIMVKCRAKNYGITTAWSQEVQIRF